jgi:hypothetical protein
MADNLFETRVNFVFFLAGAAIGILGGLLSGFCVSSFYRWFDIYNKEKTIHPYSFLMSIDFWTFVVTLIGIIGITLIFYIYIKRIVNDIKVQQGLTQESSDKNQNESALPKIIEKCPICGKVFKGQSNYCELCGKRLRSKNKKSKKKDVHSIFIKLTKNFEKNGQFYAIIAAISAMISLSPLFLNVLLGSNWLNQMLGSQIGFFSLIFLLTSSFIGGLFIILIVFLFLYTYFLKLLRSKLHFVQKILLSVLIMLGAITFACLILFICTVWFVLRDPVIYYTSFILFFIDIIIALLFILGCIYHELCTQLNNRGIATILGFFFIIILAISIIMLLSLIPLWTIVSEDMSKYYSNKKYDVTFELVNINQTNNETPVTILLKEKIESIDGGSFDNYYAQCHWSTNYGYFMTLDSDSSLIKTYPREFIIPKCSQFEDRIIWTYDITDLNKTKVPVQISLKVEDPNKVIKFEKLGDLSDLGGAYLNLTWSNVNKIKKVNESIFIF